MLSMTSNVSVLLNVCVVCCPQVLDSSLPHILSVDVLHCYLPKRLDQCLPLNVYKNLIFINLHFALSGVSVHYF